MTQYPKYKPSGIEWLGNIPEHWELKRNKLCFSYQKGKIPKKLTDKHNENFPIYLSMDVLRGEPKQIFYVENTEGCIIVKDNDFLLLWDGSNAGEFVNSKKGVLSSTMAVLDFNNELLERNFFKHYLKLFENNLRDTTIGMGIPHVNGEELLNSFFLLPPLNEQISIANYLDEKTALIDKCITQKQNQIELLKEEKTAIINEAVTKGIDKKAKLKPSGIEWLGDVPEHWEVRKIGHLANITKLTGFEYTNKWETFPEGEIIALRGYNIGDGKLDISKVERISIQLSNELMRSKLYTNDIVYPCTGTIGNAAIIESDDKYHINQNIAKVTPNSLVFPKFLLFALLSSSVKSQIHFNNASQMQPVILISDLRQMKISLPKNLKEQQNVCNLIESAIINSANIIEKIEREIELMQEYRTALISEVVTGKVDVRSYKVESQMV